MYICILICWHIAIKMFFFGLLEKRSPIKLKIMFWWVFFFFFKELLLKNSLLCLKYKLFSCVCPGPGLLNSKLEFSIQKAQRTQQPMSISLSKFASLSHSCAENGNECILHMYTFGYTRTTTLWLKWTLLQIGFKMWRTKLQYFFSFFI